MSSFLRDRRRQLTFLLSLTFLCSCRERAAGGNEGAMEQHVFAVNIVPDSTRLAEYLDYHRHVWPEVEAGFKKAGYKEIVLYRCDHLVVMTITVPRGANLDKMGKEAESYNPRCAAWNRLMATYQTGEPGAGKGATWVEMKSFYTYGEPK